MEGGGRALARREAAREAGLDLVAELGPEGGRAAAILEGARREVGERGDDDLARAPLGDARVGSGGPARDAADDALGAADDLRVPSTFGDAGAIAARRS